MLFLSSDNWLWPSNTIYKFCSANFSPSGILYSMINCISYAITLDHRMCIQNRLAEPSCVLSSNHISGHISQPWSSELPPRKISSLILSEKLRGWRKFLILGKLSKVGFTELTPPVFAKPRSFVFNKPVALRWYLGKGLSSQCNLVSGKSTEPSWKWYETLLQQFVGMWLLGPSLLICKFCLAKWYPLHILQDGPVMKVHPCS